jgi:hypothetical protein
VVATVCFAAATYLHFLIGGFWFVAAMALRLMGTSGGLQHVAAATTGFFLLVAPLLGAIVWSRLVDGAGTAGTAAPPVDVIYSSSAVYHMAPFARHRFRVDWLPGYLLAGGMIFGAVVLMRLPETAALRGLARWLVFLLLYLFLALLAAYLDRDTAILGKFYLFRPASPILLLWLFVIIAGLGRLGLRHGIAVKLAALALIAPLFLVNAINRIAAVHHDLAEHAAEKRGLAQFLAQSAAPDAVVLIDPELELTFLDFERRTGHAMLVAFVPTGLREIQEWHRRSEFRKSLFTAGCRGQSYYRVDWILTSADHAAALVESCGEIAYRVGQFALLRHAH